MPDHELHLFRSYADMSKEEWGRYYGSWDEWEKGEGPTDKDRIQMLTLGALQRIARSLEKAAREDRARRLMAARRVLRQAGISERKVGWSNYNDLERMLVNGETFDELVLLSRGAADRLKLRKGTKIRERFLAWQKKYRATRLEASDGSRAIGGP